MSVYENLMRQSNINLSLNVINDDKEKSITKTGNYGRV